MKGEDLLLEIGKICAIYNDIVGGTEPLGSARLAAQNRLQGVSVHAVARSYPFPLQRFRRVYHQYPVYQGGFPGFQQQGDDPDAVRA